MSAPAQPIYYFTDEYSWLSNFDTGHEIKVNHDWLYGGEQMGPAFDVGWFWEGALISLAKKNDVKVDNDGSLVIQGVERLFQALKTDDVEVATRILGAKTPGESKRLGRSPRAGGIVADLREGWDNPEGHHKRGLAQDAMQWCLQYKFADEYAGKLAKTGYRMLVEGNRHGDTRWGAVWNTMGVLPSLETNPPVWARGALGMLQGHNWLGRQLMYIRSMLDCGVDVNPDGDGEW